MKRQITDLLADIAEVVDLIDATTALFDILEEIDATNKLNLRSILVAEYILLKQTKHDIHKICSTLDSIVLDLK